MEPQLPVWEIHDYPKVNNELSKDLKVKDKLSKYVVIARHMTEASVLRGIIREYIKHTTIIRDWPNIESGPYSSGGGFGKKVLLIVSGTDEQMIRMGRDLMSMMDLEWEPIYDIKEVWKKEMEEVSEELKAGKH